MLSVTPLHEVVGRNVTQYANVTDPEQVFQLGPENLDRTTNSGEPDYLDCSQGQHSAFSDVTSTLTGNYYSFPWSVLILILFSC